MKKAYTTCPRCSSTAIRSRTDHSSLKPNGVRSLDNLATLTGCLGIILWPLLLIALPLKLVTRGLRLFGLGGPSARQIYRDDTLYTCLACGQEWFPLMWDELYNARHPLANEVVDAKPKNEPRIKNVFFPGPLQ